MNATRVLPRWNDAFVDQITRRPTCTIVMRKTVSSFLLLFQFFYRLQNGISKSSTIKYFTNIMILIIFKQFISLESRIFVVQVAGELQFEQRFNAQKIFNLDMSIVTKIFLLHFISANLPEKIDFKSLINDGSTLNGPKQQYLRMMQPYRTNSSLKYDVAASLKIIIINF